MKQKLFGDTSGAASKLWEDVGTNNVMVYDVDDYLDRVSLRVHPPTLTDKWSHVTVAASGEPMVGRDWLVVAPYRIDGEKESGKKVYDIDPVLFVFSTETASPHPSGVVAYHQSFPGRTTEVPGYEPYTLDQTVQDLRERLTTGRHPLEQAPNEILEAMQHMVRKFGKQF